MSLKAILDSLEGLPEALSKEYVQGADGRFRLDVEGGFKTADEVTKLHSALEAERKAAREANAKLKPYGGIDAEEARKALSAYANFDEATKKAVSDAEAVFKAKLAPVEDRAVKAETALADMTGKYHAHLKANTFANAKCIKELCHEGMQPEVVFRVLGDHVSVEDGEVVFTDAAGMKILDINGKTDANKAIHQLLTTTPYGQSLLKPANGAGTQPGAGSGRPGITNPWKKETFNLTEQSKIAAEDPARAKALAESAGVPF